MPLPREEEDCDDDSDDNYDNDDVTTKILAILFPQPEDTLNKCIRLRPLLYLLRQMEKKEFPLEEDYCVRLHVVDENLECNFLFVNFW